MNVSDVAIYVLGLHKTFGDVLAVDGLDLTVRTGQVHGLVGPNGAGKTTLLRILFGLVEPDDGEVTLLDRDPGDVQRLSVGGVGGFVEEPRFYPYLTARRNLGLMADLDGAGHGRVEKVLEAVGLRDVAGRKVGGFSSGMRQRLGLGASLLRRPRVLLLDEPTIGLDPSGIRDMLGIVRLLASEGTAVLVSSHNMSELEEVSDGVTVIRDGRSVWSGSMDRLHAEAPAPEYRVETSDDARAVELAGGLPRVSATPDPGGWLVVDAEREALDAYVVALGRAGVAVRRLELLMTALESMFFSLTGVHAADPSGDPRADELVADP
jgi:ABC-2 type transport system ATP-binding protein